MEDFRIQRLGYQQCYPTILASVAMGYGNLLEKHALAFCSILVVELVMLASGMWVHTQLHKTHLSHRWAEARLLAEVTRSVLAIGKLHVYLGHLFTLPFPPAIRAFLRTINVLHLQSTRHAKTDWQQLRDHYVQQRLIEPEPKGQVPFYSCRKEQAATRLWRAHTAFLVFWCIAAFATSLKLILHVLEVHEAGPVILGTLGTFAIVMPVLAAGALSFAAALDLEAQEHTYHEMHEFLGKQVERLRNARSQRDYCFLVTETEMRLLGETANWFSRRSFMTVA